MHLKTNRSGRSQNENFWMFVLRVTVLSCSQSERDCLTPPFSPDFHVSWKVLASWVGATTTTEITHRETASVHCPFVSHTSLNGWGGRVWKVCVVAHCMHYCLTGGRALAWAASDRWDWQATKQQVHGREERLKQADWAEGGASVRSEVDFVGVRTGRLNRTIAMAGRTREGKEKEGQVEKNRFLEATVNI